MKKINLILIILMLFMMNLIAKDLKEYDDRLGKEVLIPEGDYYVGSNDEEDEKPLRLMHFKAFYIDIHPVTNIQYLEFLKVSKYKIEGGFDVKQAKENPLKPATNLTLNDAMAYAKYFNRRLPTEWEWEIAARSLKKENIYAWGKKIEEGKCNWLDSIDKPRYVSPVFEYPANELGLYDMAGNVYEWTISEYPKEFLVGRYVGGHKIVVLRGGAWTNIIYDLRVSMRVPFAADRYLDWIGFRTVREYNK